MTSSTTLSDFKLVLDGVTKAFDQTQVLKAINLAVEPGEFVVLVGPSGCGKSTVLRLIAGLESVSQGNIYIEGALMNGVSPKDRDIAMVFQNYALYPHMSVYDNMAFALKMRQTPKSEIQAKVQAAADILELTSLLHRKPRQLSGGQRQRVALGRAIVRNPKVFLMDEPLSNLDAKLRVQMRSEIQKLHHRLEATTIYVTHDQTEAMTMGDRIVVLNGGVIQQVAPPMEMYHRPANQFVGSFIGAMPFVEARYENGYVHLEGTAPWQLPASVSHQLDKSHPRQVIRLGIRPEWFSSAHRSPTQQAFTVTPTLIEPLGADTLVHFTLGGTTMTALVPSINQPRVGHSLELVLNLDHINYFDPATEANIIETPALEPVA